MLQSMGASIRGTGSNVLRIKGTASLRGATARIWPDHIETGTFAALAAACHGTVTIRNAVPAHLDIVVHILQRWASSELDAETMVVRPAELMAIPKIQTGCGRRFPPTWRPSLSFLLLRRKA
jgi:UDP-N-acetylglucosamine 1-carboxyvinyltransferase